MVRVRVRARVGSPRCASHLEHSLSPPPGEQAEPPLTRRAARLAGRTLRGGRREGVPELEPTEDRAHRTRGEAFRVFRPHVDSCYHDVASGGGHALEVTGLRAVAVGLRVGELPAGALDRRFGHAVQHAARQQPSLKQVEHMLVALARATLIWPDGLEAVGLDGQRKGVSHHESSRDLGKRHALLLVAKELPRSAERLASLL